MAFTQPKRLYAPDTRRQLGLAQALRAQGLQAPQGQAMGSGTMQRYVAPSWTQYAGGLAQSLAGMSLEDRAQQQHQDRVSELSQALRGPEPIPEGIRQPGYEPPSTMERLQGLEDNPLAQRASMQLAMQGGGQPDWQEVEVNTGQGTQTGFVDMNASNPEATIRLLGEPAPDLPSSVQEYQYARENPEFAAYQRQQAEAGGTNVYTGDLPAPETSEVRQLRDTEVATKNLVSTVNDALMLMQNNPDVNTWTGRGASLVNDLQQEAGAFARGMGLEFDEQVLDPSSYEESFDKLGIENARMRSLITSLAFQAAASSGQTGRGVSDRDVQRFIDEVGASSSDPRAFANVLRDVAERSVRNFRTNYEVRTEREFGEDMGLSNLPQEGSRFDDETEALIRKYTQ